MSLVSLGGLGDEAVLEGEAGGPVSQSFELLLLLALGRVLREREAGRAFGVGRRVGDCGGRKHVSEDGEVRVLGLEGGGV